VRRRIQLCLVLTLTMVLAIGSLTVAQASPLGKTVKSLTVKGNSLITKEEILKVVAIKPGDKLDADKLQKDLQAIYNLGYFYDVTSSFQEDKDGVTVSYEVVENPIIKKIKIQGNTKYSTEQLETLMQTTINRILNSQ